MDTPPSTPATTQTWLTIVSSIAAAVGALLAKKRFTRRQQPVPPKPDLITRTEFHQALDSVRDKLDAVHKDLASAITTQGAIIEKRLDALESGVARLDERTKILSTFGSAEPLEVKIHHAPAPAAAL